MAAAILRSRGFARYFRACRQPVQHIFRCLNADSKQKDNIILIGSPGCGKTSVGRLLGEKLGMAVLDIDDDHLAPHWNMNTADKLNSVGSKRFIEEEGQALMQLEATGKVISTSGSNPMHSEAMHKISKTGLVVFLDSADSSILKRLDQMRVDRIVGQEVGVPMSEILKHRQQFYENSYDIRIICGEDESLESVTEKVTEAIEGTKQTGYISTRGDNNNKSFQDVILQGLAPDGGLYVPHRHQLPSFTLDELKRLVDISYSERTLRILEKWISPTDLHPRLLRTFINNAYGGDAFQCHVTCPVHHLEGEQYVLELFHGPTASFKDMALQLMPQFFQYAIREKSDTNEKYLFLVATTGDTGGAVLDGVARHTDGGIGILVLYPEDGISAIQKWQMNTIKGKNVLVKGVKSDFDFLQSSIKSILGDQDFKEQLKMQHNCSLSAANSINWGRLLPQVVYHLSSYLDLIKQGVISLGDEVDLCVPTGNFGNIIAAYYAKQMGIPYKRLICASNSNNILTEFFKTGRYDLTTRPLCHTKSPAIDVLKSSNLERLLYHVTGSSVAEYYQSLEKHKYFQVSKEIQSKMKELFIADWCSDEECSKAIKDTYERTGYIIDPHTAVAKSVADKHTTNERPMIITSTAHNAKFAEIVLDSIGLDVSDIMHSPAKMFERVEALSGSPLMHNQLKAMIETSYVANPICEKDYSEIRNEVEQFAGRL